MSTKHNSGGGGGSGSSTETAIVIMAGGAGERFWPVSNRATPKQLLRLHGEQTLLEMAFARAARIVPPGRIYIAAGERLRGAILHNLPELDLANYISEPFARNTAACLGLAACQLEAACGSDAVMGVLTADHVIEEGPRFAEAVRAAIRHAAESDDLVTLGIHPTYPETGFGYLELGAAISKPEGEPSGETVYRVRRFTEKPDLQRAESFLAAGNYLWNSGMFFWKVRTLLKAFEDFHPEMAAGWKRLRSAGPPPFPPALVEEVFRVIPSLPIDIAIMERSDRVAAVRGQFVWEDVGSWDALSRMIPSDEAGNCGSGDAIFLESRNNIAYNDVGLMGTEGPIVVLSGVEDLLVVRTDKAILITHKSRVQKVKEVVRHLKETGREDLI